MEKGDGSNESSKPKNDPGWNYVRIAKPPNKNDLICNFCEKVTKGGIFRAKQHIIGGHRNVKGCTRCPSHVREEIKEFMLQKSSVKVEAFEDDEYFGRSSRVTKRPRQKGPIDVFFAPNPAKSVESGKKKMVRQSTIDEACKKELREKACRDFARWMYDAAIPFNAINYPSFQVAIESIGQFGPGMKPPSYHEVRDPFLKKEVDDVNGLMKLHEEEWSKYGCSIICDGWTDKKNRTLVNFLVNSPRGTFFLESVDASDCSKTDEMMCALIDSYIVRVGVENVVQVITDSASSNVSAGKMLMEKRQHLYWTPCAAHCIDLIMEGIGKLPIFHRTLKKVMSLNAYICVRPGVVRLLKEFTGHKELVPAGVTRFPTAFFTLQRVHKLKIELRKMFTSKEWSGSNWVKEAGGKHVTQIILMPFFWNSIVYILKIFGPLVRVLRLVGGEKKPTMGYIYEAMDRCKEVIIKSFNNNEEKYEDVFQIIDKKWTDQLHQPLHAAGYYLNPEFFYSSESDITQDEEVMKGFYASLERLIPSHGEQDIVTDQMSKYQNAEGLFGIDLAIRQRKTKSPAEWWRSYGSSTPNLQKFALKVLSLTCSVSGYERNWSIFENIHSKKRNRLARKRLNDLVFVKYNRALKRGYDLRDRVDPISLNVIDDSNEWLMSVMDGENDETNDLVFDDDPLTLDVVGISSGVGEESYNTQSIKETSQKRSQGFRFGDEEGDEFEEWEEDNEEEGDFIDDDYKEEEKEEEYMEENSDDE